MNYSDRLKQIGNLTFDSIIELNRNLLPLAYQTKAWKYPGLNHGTAVLSTEEECSAYIAAYGKMHQDKIQEVLNKIKINDFQNTDLQIIDWGCGQGVATVCLMDFFKKANININNIQKIILIEPSTVAIERAEHHINAYLEDDDKIETIKKYIDDVTVDEINSNQPVTIHLFSNILDISSIDLRQLANKIKHNLKGIHFFFCWGPLNYGNARIDSFWGYFNEADEIFFNAHSKQEYTDDGKLKKEYGYTAKNRVFKVNGDECELILVNFYQSKQFHAAYLLDSVRNALQSIDKDILQGLYKNLSDFEIQAPFDIGASIYDDIHPILATLNNIVTRGLPTKASPCIEDAFAVFGNKRIDDELGGINYCIDNLDTQELFLAMHLIDSRWNITPENYNVNVLDSDLEKTYITEKVPPILRQLLQPQRQLASICSKSCNSSQRVDFAFEFPYATKDYKGQDFHGCVIEIDGKKYHSETKQLLFDKQRNQVLSRANWYCFRLKENDIGKEYTDYYHLGSDYVECCEQVFRKKYDDKWVKYLQLVLSPIAVARLEKTILEALMTGMLDIKATTWKVLVIEHDIPCAALAFKELRQMFENISQLSTDYSNMLLPKVDLTIISTKEFAESPLHLEHKVLIDEYRSNTQFDMVIDFAMLRRNGLEKINFSDYQCKNKCYFHVRSAHYHRNDRKVYTAERILYKPIVYLNNQGHYDNIEENVKLLRYFLKMLFRKQDFRVGQTPILNRALQYKSVIGLLPTGGGKSLTYQIAAFLQPGVTLIIDPLRSLMKDQFDGLIEAGIDCCTYINSSIKVPESFAEKGTNAIRQFRAEERERRSRRMEKSELLFVFLSPERLSILDFRNRLKNMRDTGVYFAYGVIDEVHCVSEWGHDFRFSYLHLGKNIYKYVLPKPKDDNDTNSHIPLFGLTATASFDVLADVERELSGNGAFPLDAQTIVREGDTNRLEIQYKIESIPVTFKCRERDGAIKLSSSKWDVFDSKKEQIDNVISKIPSYFRELLTEESVQTIIEGYTKGPRADGRKINPLQTNIPNDFLAPKESYEYGGIVFCPHKDNTGVAVFPNKIKIEEYHPNIQIGTFVGSSDDDEKGDIEQVTNREEESFANLELFRDNEIPLMIATKAFGMGIDKPNVRFTINLNYSSSLESFVQEAGRGGRDKRMALAIIALSRYRIARVKSTSEYYHHNKNKWFNASDIEELARLKGIPLEDFEVCDETSDLVKLKCNQCGSYCSRFENNCCNCSCQQESCNHRNNSCRQGCEYAEKCELATIPTSDRWSFYEHLKIYKERYPFIKPDNYEYLNADYETVIFFYNNNFKGELIEKKCMHQLLSKREISISLGDEQNSNIDTVNGFLTTLLDVATGTKVISYISYTKAEYADIAKAIYRMCCIDLIDDFTQDYNSKSFRIVSKKKEEGHYYKALEQYLRRYYTRERAEELIKEVPSYKGDNEIHKCLGYLTHFIYEKIAVKRKRAIDDMFTFCVHGVDDTKDWKVINEELKDELYFYFNSKYARHGYTTEKGNPFSLLDDTDNGKLSTAETVFKFMCVVNNQWIADNSEAGSTQIDNAKHLYGAVRLIRRNAPEDNPTIYLLGAFCLMFLGTNNNPILEQELETHYIEGMKLFYETSKRKEFWKDIFNRFNASPAVSAFFENYGDELKSLTSLKIHGEELSNIKNKYTK